MKLLSYEEYSATGSWLGEIPTHWFNSKLKYIAGFTTGLTPPTSDSSNYDSKDKPWFRPEDLSEKGSLEINASKKISASAWKKLRQIPVGSTLLCCIGSIGKLGYLTRAATSNQQITAVTPKFNIVNPKLIFWILAASQRELNSLSMGNVVKILNTDRLGELRVPLPPNNEQQKIAQFLDYETAKIDALIDEQKRLIELLKEKRQTVISHAVTKGLNPDAPMKDSGVEWLGEVPEHWGAAQLRYLFEFGLQNGIFKKANDFGSGTKLINVSDIFRNDGYIDISTLERVKASPNELARYQVKPGDLFFVRSSLKLEGIAKTAVYSKTESESVIFECHIVKGSPKINEVLPEFLFFYCNSEGARNYFISIATTATMTTISQSAIGTLKVTVPPIDEQKKIIEFIRKHMDASSELEKEASSNVALLKERRSALISAAVSGKIDVRDWQPPAGSDTVDSNTSMQTERHYG